MRMMNDKSINFEIDYFPSGDDLTLRDNAEQVLKYEGMINGCNLFDLTCNLHGYEWFVRKTNEFYRTIAEYKNEHGMISPAATMSSIGSYLVWRAKKLFKFLSNSDINRYLPRPWNIPTEEFYPSKKQKEKNGQTIQKKTYCR